MICLRCAGRLLLLLLLSAFCGPQVTAQPPRPSQSRTGDDAEIVPRAGAFLLAATAPTANLRRTSRFLDVDRIDKHLQVALLVDGTDSMQQDLQSLKQNLRALLGSLKNVHREPAPTVEVAFIVYRDSGSPSGSVTPLIGRFEPDIDKVEAQLQALQAQSGAPYFREALDQGLHYALSELDWRDRSQEGVSRWIIVAGDAPPYPEGADLRRHSDQQLIRLAQEKQIAIYGMALGSGLVGDDPRSQRLRRTAAQERPDLKTFLGRMARATGGRTADLLDENSVRYWMTHRLQMPPITDTHVADRRQQQTGDARQPRIAVLPHLPLEQMDFDSRRDEVVIATHLRQRLDRLRGVDVVSAVDVERAFDAAAGSPTLPELSARLQADYVIWGTQTTSFDYLVIESRLYDGVDGSLLAAARESVKPTSDEGRLMILNVIFRRLCEAGSRELDMLGRTADAQVLGSPWNDAVRTRRLMTPLSDKHRAQSAILTGLDELERSLTFVKPARSAGSSEVNEPAPAADELDAARSHLQAAAAALEQALAIDADNPYAHLLLANCCQNLNHDLAVGELDPRCRSHLQQAAARADARLDRQDPVRLEIKAQYALLVTKDIGSAIEHYARLAGGGQTDARFALRAHWMLAGIRLGDWDAMSWGWDYVDPVQAREHILAILADWPDSPEAAFYRNCIKNSTPESLDVPVGAPQLARSF